MYLPSISLYIPYFPADSAMRVFREVCVSVCDEYEQFVLWNHLTGEVLTAY